MLKRLVMSALTICALTSCGSDDQPTDFLTVVAGVNRLGGNITMRVEQPGRTSTITHAQLEKDANASNMGIAIPTGHAGTMRVSFVLVGSANETISSGQFQLGLQKGFIYSVSAQRYPANFETFCFGCGDVAKFPIRDTQKPTTDSLWVFYSAAPPLCKGCVY